MTSRARGFTLIELLLAISILAIIAVLGWRGLDSIVRSRATLNNDMEQTRGLQLAFAQMQSDCENLASSTLLRNRPFLQAEDNRITLVRMVLGENQPTRLQVVSYRVANGVLTRRESSYTRDLTQLDVLWQAGLSDNDPSAAVALQSGLQNMSMRLWVPSPGAAPGSNTGSGGWRNANGVSTAGGPGLTLPTGLEVSLVQQAQTVPLVKAFLLGAL
ncbi:prepilin-type N-terminal cleavage/methylation domain-containing protein [Duganella sp. CY15W]|uniref:PulJ/GspJ family protein n=1 Tax=Duganella sp. CY15W TaxID=2692172 RepID=UPI001369FA7B|nr:prepilin-type N-terminal cleavage/methylation domain-containing protein [Duganella sp. CY15W]MYM29004.1 prepilin-type N-terminal cleavage/methylation domain-containing protein [Duganella sp. CY15W]